MRLKPRSQPAGGQPPAPDGSAPSAAPAPEQAEGTGRLRLKPRLTVEEPIQQLSAPPEPPAPIAPEALPVPEIFAPPGPELEDAPKFKFRPKGTSEPPLPPLPAAAPPAAARAPAPAAPVSVSMPPMSVLSAAPPPRPGAPAEGGGVAAPRLSLANPAASPAGMPPVTPGSLLKSASKRPPPVPVKPGVKPPVKPGKPGAALRKRPTLTPVAKAGVGVLVIALAVGSVFFYKIFFPKPVPVIPIKILPIVKPVHVVDPKLLAAEALIKAAAASGKGVGITPAHGAAGQPNPDAGAAAVDVPPAPPVTGTDSDAGQAVMAQANLSSDVKVNNTPIVAAPAANAAFRAYVANASIDGVFQGSPAKALINGRIVREGQVLDGELGIVFARIDSETKVIYFKDGSGAEVSKNY